MMDNDVKHAVLELIRDARDLIKTTRHAVTTASEATVRNLQTPYGRPRAEAVEKAIIDAANAVRERAERLAP